MEAKLMAKGFLFTLSVFLLLGFLLSFSVYYSPKPRDLSKELTTSLKIEKAAYVADDLEIDLNRLLGVNLDLNNQSTTAIATIDDRLPSDFNRLALSAWETFVTGPYAQTISSTIDLNTAGMTDANAELFFSNGIQYLFTSTDANSVQLFVPGGDTNFTNLDINLFVNDDLNNSAPWVPGTGDTNVTLRYGDNNAANAVFSSGLLSSTAATQYLLRYSSLSTDSLTITFGRLAGSDAGIRIEDSIDNPATVVKLRIKFTVASPGKPLTVSANVDFNYVQADMNLGRRLVIARG